jgi:hypothetical protein
LSRRTQGLGVIKVSKVHKVCNGGRVLGVRGEESVEPRNEVTQFRAAEVEQREI